MVSAAEASTGERLKEILYSSNNYPHVEDLEQYPFWQGKKIPEKIVILTSSERKRVLVALVLLMIQNVAIPEELSGLIDPNNPIKLYEILAELFVNGDGEAKGEQFLGNFFGVPVVSMIQRGEHDQCLTDRVPSESHRKIAGHLSEIEEVDPEVAAKTLYLSLDSTGLIRGEKVGKPQKLFDWIERTGFPVDEVDFIEWYIKTFLSGGVIITESTTVAAAWGDFFLFDLLTTVLETSIDETALENIRGNFDFNAGAAAATQRSINLNLLSNVLLARLQHLKSSSGELVVISPETKLALENIKNEYLSVLIIAQIMGFPIVAFLERLVKATSSELV